MKITHFAKIFFHKAIAVVIAGACVTVTAANATNISCFSSLALVGVSNTGDVFVKLADASGMIADAHYICNISTQGSYITSPEACKSTLTVLTTARLKASIVYIDYATIPSITTCQAIPAWSYQYGAHAVRF